MHGAPAVTFPVGRSRSAAALVALAWMLGAVATGWWAVNSPGEGAVRPFASAALLTVLGFLALFSWARTPAGSLTWDGEAWSWCCEGGRGEAGAVAVRLDLQRWLLLHWTGAHGARWLWLAGGDCPERWDDLRRAVYSRARPRALTGVKPPAATP